MDKIKYEILLGYKKERELKKTEWHFLYYIYYTLQW